MEEITRTQLKNNLGEYLQKSFREPVAVTDRGRISHVVMAFDHYTEMVRRLEALEADKNRPATMLDASKQG